MFYRGDNKMGQNKKRIGLYLDSDSKEKQLSSSSSEGAKICEGGKKCRLGTFALVVRFSENISSAK